MKNHDDYDNDEYPWGNNTYDSEDCYGRPYDWSQARQNSHPVQPCIKNLAAKQPVSAVDADMSNPS